VRAFNASALVAYVLFTVLDGCHAAQNATPAAIPQVVSAEHRADALRYRILFSFQGAPDEALPAAGLVNVDAMLYGTTTEGGAYNDGTVFALRPTGGWKVLLYSFAGGNDGANPAANLIAADGNLYGTTESGGAYGMGTVFRVNAKGHETVLHSFGSDSDGAEPQAPLTLLNGKLYGTTFAGGAHGYGTVFRISPNGAERVLHSFSVGYNFGTDGSHPVAGLIVVNGLLYGTTPTGGKNAAGVLFSMSTNGAETVLYDFDGTLPAAREPDAPLVLLNGTFYGTAGGGANDYGTVFSIRPSGKDEAVLHSFGSTSADGRTPVAGLTVVKGTLYGTTEAGGTSGYGTLYSITRGGAETVLHDFAARVPPHDGQGPEASLTGVNGRLYGTTHAGGISGLGTVFSLKP
jgi:uncharacterized repeat protein (TIGR03803 family)